MDKKCQVNNVIIVKNKDLPSGWFINVGASDSVRDEDKEKITKFIRKVQTQIEKLNESLAKK